MADLLAFLAASTLVILIPGPDTLVVLRGILVHGRRSALLTAVGVLTGLSIWVAAAALGVTALLRASHDGYLALRLVGAAYLLFIGIQALRSRIVGQPLDLSSRRRPSLVGRGFRAGVTTDLLNPKVGVFFIAFLPAFVPHGQPVALVTLGLGAMFVIETGLYFAVMLVSVQRLLKWLGDERIRKRLNRATGVVLVGFGIRLAVEG